MIGIDLDDLIERFDLDINQVATLLFPGNKHARPALLRVRKGESFLDSRQISDLATYYGIPVNAIFGGAWQRTAENAVDTYTRGDITVRINRATGEAFAFQDGKPGFTQVLAPAVMDVREYLDGVAELLKNKTNTKTNKNND